MFRMKEPLKRENGLVKFKCPYLDCRYFNKDLKRHLILKHGWSKETAKEEVSCRLKMFRYLSNTSHNGVYKPRVSFNKGSNLVNLV